MPKLDFSGHSLVIGSDFGAHLSILTTYDVYKVQGKNVLFTRLSRSAAATQKLRILECSRCQN